MINYESILSTFDGKPTLLQWLKMVKKALDESVLKDVTITQNGEKVVFSFNFEDGTSISTPEVTLPKGDKGDKGENGVGIVNIETSGSNVVGVNTESTIRVELSDGSVKQFKTYAKNGTDGVSITGINTVGNEVVGDETLTTLRAHYSNNTTDEFVVTAKNGKDAAGGNTYLHSVRISEFYNEHSIYFNFYSRKENITLEDALKYIPTNSGFVPVCVEYSSNKGVVCALKIPRTTGYLISVYGVVVNTNDNTTSYINYSFEAKNFQDTLLGVNL